MADERFVDAPPAGGPGWREVWQDDRRFAPRPSKHEWLLRLVRRLFRRAAEPDTDRQKNFNLVLLDLLEDIRCDAEAIRRDLRGDVENVQRDLRHADEELAREVGRLRELIPVAAKRNDALVAALDQKIETVAARVRDAINPRAERAAEGGGAPLIDVTYRRLEDALRGSEEQVKDSVREYVARAQAPVIDVGCGRGELLAACREADLSARGFDTNERSIAELRQRGLDASVAGIPECFREIANGSIGTVVAMHVVEHLPVELLFTFFAEASRVLRAGGLLIVETPNAESLLVTGSDFWRDPTHLAPRHPAALTLLAREHGFDLDEVRAIHPYPDAARLALHDDDPPVLRRALDAINERLFGPQDLRLIARKR
jgi:2-polyprenyl-3-methyl-5-hydroxy-6-metoxy-1,4-benzoquinol methylase